MKQIDERERLAVLAANIGYFNNSKKPKFKKIFDRQKEERQLKHIYESAGEKAVKKHRLAIYQRVRKAFGAEGG
ncbi:hypothetical protein [Leuconostoc fallax]|uniref:hypothetical protein n=1 Tax=Leuconostoc fallax TaxID=1251 RepID=UPI001C1E8F32|nr:hypothetical protein [Leuconostoc fallax]MBU7455840.1 hypothetical protein [Leuconostoc fallax]